MAGGALALGTGASALAALAQLGDQQEPLARNAAEAASQFVGGGAGSLAGAGIGFAVGGPIGATVGSVLGGIGGSMVGAPVGGGVYDAIAGDPNDPIRQQQRMRDFLRDAQVKDLRALMGPQAEAAALAQRNEIARTRALAAIQGDAMLQQALAQGLLQQQAAGAQNLDRTMAAILGYGGGGYA